MRAITESEARAYLHRFAPPPNDYVEQSLRRFIETLKIMPAGEGELLELGCDNYFSLLLREYTQYEIYCHNLPEGASKYQHKADSHSQGATDYK